MVHVQAGLLSTREVYLSAAAQDILNPYNFLELPDQSVSEEFYDRRPSFEEPLVVPADPVALEY